MPPACLINICFPNTTCQRHVSTYYSAFMAIAGSISIAFLAGYHKLTTMPAATSTIVKHSIRRAIYHFSPIYPNSSDETNGQIQAEAISIPHMRRTIPSPIILRNT